jgi:hypothetical protein
MAHGLRLVNFEKGNNKPVAIERIREDFRRVYRGWNSVEDEANQSLKRQVVDLWRDALEEYSVDTIKLVFKLILRGKTPYNSAPPTPMQFAKLCGDITGRPNPSIAPTSPTFSIFD